MTPEAARLLLSYAGRQAVDVAASLDLSPAAAVASAEAVRRFGPVGPLALEQAHLRRRALAKRPDGDRLWWTAEALEQATAQPVAAHRAERFAGAAWVFDLGCSVGGDLLELQGVAPAVGVDLDEARLLLARANGARSLVRADVTRLSLPASAAVFVDPARRSSGRRTTHPRSWSPPLDRVLAWQVRSLGVKVAPGIDYAELPGDVEVEVVSLGGGVREAVLWRGEVRRGARRTATVLPGPHTLTDRGVPAPPVRPPGRYLLEPDGVVIRAHLVAELAEQLDGWLLDSTIAYIAADVAVATPFGRWYEVQEHLAFSLKRLRERLRLLDAGTVVIKKRGTAVVPEVLRRQLGLSGSREVTVVLTRSAGAQIALVVRPC